MNGSLYTGSRFVVVSEHVALGTHVSTGQLYICVYAALA